MTRTPPDHGDSDSPVEALASAWLSYPPAPDLATFVTDGVRSDKGCLLNLVRVDAQNRVHRGEPICLEDYARAISAEAVAPGTALALLVLGFERLAGASSGEVRARLEDAYATDIDAVFADEEPMPPQGVDEASTADADPDRENEDEKSWGWGRRFTPGTIINGRYRLVRQLDLGHDGKPRGAFGQVWEAQHLIELRNRGVVPPTGNDESSDHESKKRTTQRLAIKFIRRDRADPAVLKRFIEVEPKALARLSHPYIARFHELGFADGDPYLVMEYVHGGPITEYADAKKLKLDDRIALMVKACDAVQHVHNNGLLHRDLKPVNLLVTEVEGKGRREAVPKLIDFGLAMSSTNEHISSQVTESGVVAGSRPYMSPEQWNPERDEPLTQAADVYGLSAMLFELLVGVTPMHHVLSDTKLTPIEKDRRCATSPRPSPLQAFNWLPREQQERIAASRSTTVAGMRRGLSGALKLLMAAAVEVEPELRLQQVSHLREDLESYLKGEPFRHVKREPLHSRVNRRVRRNPLPYAAAAAVFMTLTAGIAGTTWQQQIAAENAREARKQTEIAVANEHRAAQETDRAEREAKRATEALANEARQRAQAEQERDRALWRSLIATAASEFADDAEMRALLVRESNPEWTDPLSASKSIELSIASYHRKIRLAAYPSSVAFAEPNHDGSRFLTVRNEAVQVFRSDGLDPVVLSHHGDVLSAAWSPDGTQVATASMDGNARVWRADGMSEPIVLAHDDIVRSVAWSPDGTQIVTASNDKTVRVWRADGTGASAILAHDGAVDIALWSPDGARIATSSGRTLQIWSGDWSGQPLLIEHEKTVSSIEWSPHSTHVLTASDDGNARVWRADEKSEPVVLQANAGWLRSAQWSPDGTRVLTVSRDHLAHLWNADGLGDPVVYQHNRGVVSPSWSPDGSKILTRYLGEITISNIFGTSDPLIIRTDGGIRQLDWSPDGKHMLIIRGQYAEVADLETRTFVRLRHDRDIGYGCWVADGARIFTSGRGFSYLWDVNSMSVPVEVPFTKAAAWNQDGTRIATASDDGKAIVWCAEGTREPVVLQHEERVHSVSWSPDGTSILTRTGDNSPRVGSYRIFGPKRGEFSAQVWRSDGVGNPIVLSHDGEVWSAAWSPDGTQIATTSDDNRARLWRANGVGEPVVLQHDDALRSIAWSSSGTQIVTTSNDRSARVWRADGSGPPIVLMHNDEVHTAAWSLDDKQIITRSGRIVTIWNADGSDEPVILQHQEIVSSVALSPSGKHVLTISRMSDYDISGEAVARMWRLDEVGEPTIFEHADEVYSTAWSPDGTRILTASRDKTARVWRADGSGESVVFQHDDPVHSALWSPDGTRIATLTDNSISVWNLDGSGVPTIFRNTGWISSISWSHDSTRILTRSNENTAQIWTVDWPTLRDRLWDMLPDILTPIERIRYLGESPEEAQAIYERQKAERDQRVRARSAGRSTTPSLLVVADEQKHR